MPYTTSGTLGKTALVFIKHLHVHCLFRFNRPYKDVHNYPHFTDERTEAQRSSIPKDTNHRQLSPAPALVS